MRHARAAAVVGACLVLVGLGRRLARPRSSALAPAAGSPTAWPTPQPVAGLEPRDLVPASARFAAAPADADAAPASPLAGAAFGDLFDAVDPALMAALSPLYRRGDPGLSMLPGDLAIWQAMLDRAGLADAVSGEVPIPVTTVSGTTSHPAFRTFGASTAAALFGHHRVLDGAGHAAHLHPRFPDLLGAHLDTVG